MSSVQPRLFHRALFTIGAIASIVALTLQVLGVSGTFTWSSVLFLLCIASFALLIGLDPTRRRLRFILLRACGRAKKKAGRSIDIAAGDCSWLPRELPILTERAAKGVCVRLLCEPSLADSPNEALETLAGLPNVDVRALPADLEMYLRCIIVDRDRKQHAVMLLLDKRKTSQQLFGFLSVPERLRRDHEVTYVDPGDRLFRLICFLFDGAFEKGAPVTFNNSQEPEELI